MSATLQWIVLLLALGSPVLATDHDKCPTEADIVIILDNSACVPTMSEFNALKEKITDFLAMSHGDLNTQYSVITSSTEARTIAYFVDDVDLTTVMDPIAINVGYQNTHLALDMAGSHFSEDYGHRDGALKYIILYTEGNPRDAGLTETAATTLKDNDVTIFAVGVGRNVNMDGLDAIASDGLTYNGDDVNDVPDKHGEISAAIAEHAKTECDSCPEEADVLLILDASGSLVESDFDALKLNLPDILTRNMIADTHVRYSMMQFSTFVQSIIHFNFAFDIEYAAYFPYYEGQQTKTHLALDAAPSHFTPEMGYRPNAMKYIVIYTDGNATEPELAKSSADALKANGYTILAVGVGHNIVEDGLNDLASDGRVYLAGAMSNLPAVHDQLEKVIDDDIENLCGQCPTKADVLVVVDGSGSLSETSFNMLRTKVAEFVRDPIADLDTQYALMGFGNFVFNLKYFNFPEGLSAEMMAPLLQYDGQQTFTEKALRAVPEYFTLERGHRSRSLKYVVIFTDGNATNAAETIAEASALKDSGITIIGVAVGSDIIMSGVEQISTDGYTYDGSNMDDLSPQIFDAIRSKIEDKVTVLCGTCPDKADVLIILDASDSTYDCIFEKVKKQIAKFVLTPFPHLSTRYAFLQFGTTVRCIADFSRTRWHPYKIVMRRFRHQEGDMTNTHLALGRALQFFRPERGHRPGAMKVVLLFTDGNPSDESATQLAAETLKDSGVTLVTIGVGESVSMTLLEDIATSDLAFNGQNWRTLPDIFTQILEHAKETVTALCGGITCEMVTLKSKCYRPDTQTMDGVVTKMTLIEKFSCALCKFGKTYGYKGNKIGVAWGCWAVFNVCYQPGAVTTSPTEPPVVTTETKTVTCYGRYWWKKCNAGGRIVSISLKRKYAGTCTLGTTYKTSGNYVFVKWCYAKFRVTIEV